MKITYIGQEERRYPTLRLTGTPGQTVDVSDETATALLASPLWKKAVEPRIHKKENDK